MDVLETELPGVLLIVPQVFGDDRGFFMETYQRDRYEHAGVIEPFVQDNLSYSRRSALRGLHFQNPNPQGKLVWVAQGEVFDVAVDVRAGSPTFAQWTGYVLSAENRRQLWIPAGFAHGFCVTSDTALVAYKCTDFYNPSAEHTIQFDDPQIGIDWPDVGEPNVSEKDSKGMRLSEFAHGQLPAFA